MRKTTKKTTLGLLAEMQSRPAPKRKGPSRWIDRCEPAVQEQLDAVRAAFHAGELPHWSVSAVWEFVRDKFTLTVGRQAFSQWLAEGKDIHGQVTTSYH